MTITTNLRSRRAASRGVHARSVAARDASPQSWTGSAITLRIGLWCGANDLGGRWPDRVNLGSGHQFCGDFATESLTGTDSGTRHELPPTVASMPGSRSGKSPAEEHVEETR